MIRVYKQVFSVIHFLLYYLVRVGLNQHLQNLQRGLIVFLDLCFNNSMTKQETFRN